MFKNLPAFSLLVLITLGCQHQPETNKIDKERLSKELDSIMIEDQRYRSEMQNMQMTGGWNTSKMQELWQKQSEIDESNLSRIIEIIDQVGGYPGKSLVGYRTGRVTFYVLQHAPDSIQEQYYDFILQAATENELDKNLAAMYQDRYLMHRGEPQIFGSQIRVEQKMDSLSGKSIEKKYLWPIADTTNIDSLRMWNGLGPLEEYLKLYGISRWESDSAR